MGKRRKARNKPESPSTSEVANTFAPPVPLSRQNQRVWLFRIIAVAFPFVCLVIAEYSLYFAGKGIDPALVQKSQRSPSGNVYYLNPRVDVAYSRVDLRGPEPRGFELPRPADIIRVIVVGESSVQGYPYPSELAFPRQMELILQQQLGGNRVEVLNAGIIGISSLPLCDLVQQCVAAQPSAIVVYAGHNEFYGVGGIATNAKLSPIAIPLRKTRLIQWLTDKSPGTEDRSDRSQGPLISRMPKEVQIPPSSPLVNQGLENFRSRMEWIAGFCAGKKIPLLICSPVSNLRSQSPWSNSELSLRLKEIEEQIKAPLSEATSAIYVTELQKQCAAHPDDALLHYRLAQCQEWTGNHEDAYQSFVRARDLDQCRYRAPSTFGEALREIANQHSSDVTFLALEPIFREASDGGTPGDELFLEHVHFTIDGHWLMARSIAKPVVENLFGKTWDPTRLPSDSERDKWLGIIPEDRLVGLYLASFIGEAPPFNQALDAKEHVAALKAKIETMEKSLSPEQLKRFHSLGNNVKTDDLIDGLGRIQLGQNEPAMALEYFERSIRRRPWMPNGYFFYAAASQMMGKTEQARDYLQKSKTTVMGETIRLQNDRERLELMMRRNGVR